MIVPKKPSTAYIQYANDVRSDVQKEFPDKKMTELSKINGERWKLLTETKKKKYTKLADQDKIRHQKETT